MSSLHDWERRMIEQHNLQKPFAPENGNELLFKVGDVVIYTNPGGISFKLRITGLYQPNPIDAQYAIGKRYLLDWDCPWFPVTEDSLKKTPTSGITLDIDRFEEILF